MIQLLIILCLTTYFLGIVFVYCSVMNYYEQYKNYISEKQFKKIKIINLILSIFWFFTFIFYIIKEVVDSIRGKYLC